MGILDAPITPASLGVVPKWKANTAYTAGQQVVSPNGDIVSAITTFTSGATYNAANWLLSPTYGQIPDRALISNMPSKIYSSHRGYGQVAPENTMEGFYQAYANNVHEINVDTWPLIDGAVACLHDETLDFATTNTGKITQLDTSAVQQLTVDAGNWFGGNWGNLKVPLFAQVAAVFGNKMPMQVQAKPTTGSGAALINTLKAYGVGPATVRIASFSITELAAPIAAGYTVIYLLTGANYASQDPTALAAQGVDWVALDRTASGLTTQAAKNAEVARWHAAGIKVSIYSPLRRRHVWPWLTAGADAFDSDEPRYQRPDWVPLTFSPFKSMNFFHGMIGPSEAPASSTRGSFVGELGVSGRWRQPGIGFTLQGWGSPLPSAIETKLVGAVAIGATSIRVGPENQPLAGKPLTIDSETVTPTTDGVYDSSNGTYTVAVPALTAAHADGARVRGGVFSIDVDIVYDGLGSDNTRWPGVVFCQPDDAIYSDGTLATNDCGYLAFLRVNGQLSINGRNLTTMISGAPAAVNTAAISAPLVTSGALTSGVAVTSIPVTALATALVAGQQFYLPTGQKATVSGSAAVGATSVPVNSITPTTTVASGASLPQVVTLRLARTATAVSVTRVDTNTTLSWNDTTWFGGYFAFGQNPQSAGGLFSFADFSRTIS